MSKSITLSVGDKEKLIDLLELYLELYSIASECVQLKARRWKCIADALGFPLRGVK